MGTPKRVGMTRVRRTVALALTVALELALLVGIAGLAGGAVASIAHAEEAAPAGPDATGALGASDALGDQVLAARRARPAIRRRAPDARPPGTPLMASPGTSATAGTERRTAPGRPTEATTVDWLRRFGRVDVQSRRGP